MLSIVRSAFVVFFMYFGCLAAASAQSQPCGWMSAQELDKVFPSAAPWRVSVGGAVGACQFMGGKGSSNPIFAINQQFQSSAIEAETFVRGMRTALGKEFAVEPAPDLGGESFFYWTKSEGPQSRNFALHKDKVVLMGSIFLFSEPLPDRGKLVALLKKTLDVSPALAQAAGNCPYFDADLLRKMVGGAGFKSQQFGETSCMANNDAGAVLMISITKVQDPEEMAIKMKERDCVNLAVDGMGPLATLSHSCRSGNPRATVTFFTGYSMLQLNFMPGGEPTPVQRADLVQMSKFAAHTETDTANRPEAAAKAAAYDNASAIKKYNAYVSAFNSVNSMFYGSTKGMVDLMAEYRSQRLGTKTSTWREPILFLNTSMVRNSVQALQESARHKGSLDHAKIEAIAQRMVTNGSELLKLGIKLQSYFRSKKYVEDELALAREQDAEFLRRWQQFIDDHDQLGEEISVVERMDRIASIAQYRAQGKNLQAATSESMLYASDLIDVFDEPADFKDQEKVKTGDAIVQRLEKASEELRAETEKLSINEGRRHFSVYERLVQLIGSYRELKRSRGREKFESMVEYYNHAIKTYERIQ